MTDDELLYTVALEADESAARRSVSVIDSVEMASGKLRAELMQYGVVTQDNMRRIEQGFNNLDTAFNAHRKEIDGLQDEWRRTELVADEAIQSQIAGLEDLRTQAIKTNAAQREAVDGLGDDALKRRVDASGDISTTLGSLASVAGAGGANAEALAVGGDIFGVIEYLPRFAEGLGELGDQMLSTGKLTVGLRNSLENIGFSETASKATVATAAIGAMAASMIAIGVATNAAQKITDDSARATRGFIGAQEEYYTAVVNLASDEVRTRIEELDAQRQIDQLRLDEARAFKAQAEAAIDNDNLFVNVLGEAAIALGANVGGIQDLNTLITDLESSTGQAEIAITRLNDGLDQNAFAANDAAANAEELERQQEAQAAAGQAFLDRRAQNELAFHAQIEGMDAAARAARIEDIDREIASLQAMSLNTSISAELRTELAASELLLYQERNLLTEVTSTLADEEARITAARELATDVNQSILDANKMLVAAYEKSGKAGQEYAAALVEHDDKMRAINETSDKAIADANAKAADALIKLDAREAEERQKIADSAAEARLRADKRFNDSYSKAVRERDFTALQTAIEAHKDETEAAKENEKKRLSDLDASLRKERDAIEASRRQSEDAAARARAESIRQEETRWNTEKQNRQAAINQANVDLLNAQNAQAAARQVFQAQERTAQQAQFTALIQDAFAAGPMLVDAFKSGIQSALFTAGASSGGSYGGGGGPDFATPMTFGGGGGAKPMTLNLMVNGVMTRTDVIDIADGRIERTIDIALAGAA